MDQHKETVILEKLAHDDTPVRQRELAEIAGLSLGMTNALLKKMAGRGFLMMEKVNSRNIRYILTSDGREELNRRSRNYLKKTIKSVVYYREAVEHMVREKSRMGYENIELVGESDLEFILEWACHKHKMNLNARTDGEKTFYVYSEKSVDKYKREDSGSISLLEI